ncbi:MAG: phosphohistidine phosphatase SixA [Colwellia sp.]
MKIKIFILRHGEAEAAKTFSQEADTARHLTSFGENSVREVGRRFFMRDIELKHIFVSPYIRTQQTLKAFLAGESDNKQIAYTTTNLITPSGHGKVFHDFLDGQFCNIEEDIQGNILIISHAPFVSYLVESLTQGEIRPSFSTATMAEISYDIEKMRGDLIAITPAY